MTQRLARVASSSRYVVSLLMRAPEAVQIPASSENLELRPRELLSRSMSRGIGRALDKAAAMASVRALRRSELCWIALTDVLGATDVAMVGLAFSDLARATLDAALELTRRGVEAPSVGVIGMGCQSGYELGYVSDAGVMFVIPDGSGPEEQATVTRLARLVRGLVRNPGSDSAAVVDTGLRPEGEGGSLVRAVSSYLIYYTEWSSIWGAQVLSRTRLATGEQELASTVLGELNGLQYPDGGLTIVQVTDIRRLKSRMETERIPWDMNKERHLKLGPGGLLGVE